MIELAERPADTKPPRVPAGWYDPDSSAFEPLAGTASLSDAVLATALPAVAADRETVADTVADEGRAAR
jgi:hypothetical protein